MWARRWAVGVWGVGAVPGERRCGGRAGEVHRGGETGESRDRPDDHISLISQSHISDQDHVRAEADPISPISLCTRRHGHGHPTRLAQRKLLVHVPRAFGIHKPTYLLGSCRASPRGVAEDHARTFGKRKGVQTPPTALRISGSGDQIFQHTVTRNVSPLPSRLSRYTLEAHMTFDNDHSHLIPQQNDCRG